MNIENFRQYCIDLKGTTESFPFDQTTLVFKVMDKMYALLDLEDKKANLKVLPDNIFDLIDRNAFVSPGYHMNKKHWITVDIEQAPNVEFINQLIYNSYKLVVSRLPKKKQIELAQPFD
jgi:predicted DNA-binding protein (MmcQ/YjbR family)